MKLSCIALLLLLLCSTAQALPTGEWWVDFGEESYGTLQISETDFVFELADGQEASGFEGPVADVKEPSGNAPGRIIVGPVPKGKYRFEVVWFYPPEGPRGKFYCELQGFKTLSDAKAAVRQFDELDATVFLQKDFFEKIQAYPVLPEPDRDTLVVFLKEALARLEADPEIDSNTLMESLMIDKGFHPTKSREPFESSIAKHAGDPTVSDLLDQLEGNPAPAEGEEQES